MSMTADKNGRKRRSGSGRSRRAAIVEQAENMQKQTPAEAKEASVVEEAEVSVAVSSEAGEEKAAAAAAEQDAVRNVVEDLVPNVGTETGKGAPSCSGEKTVLPPERLVVADSAETAPEEAERLAAGLPEKLRTAVFSEELEQRAVEQMFRWAGENGRVEQDNGELSGMALLEAVHHGRQVAGLVLRLFEELAPLHELEERWAAMLVQAALWHDLGFAVGGRRGHHKLSMRIIEENTGLELSFGLAEEARPMVAMLARYHRRAWPSKKHRRFAALPDKEQKALVRAAALLRVADALDYTHKGAVEELRVRIRRRSVRIVCLGACSCRRECRRAMKKGDLFEKLFDRKLELSQEKAGSGDER